MSVDPGVRLTAALADRYRIERELGAGGMATVYLAHDLKHGRDVALKVLRPELAAMLGSERFLNEVRITGRLQHPHIVTLIDSGETDGFLWYVLPYIRGESLRHRLDREKQLGVDDALAITRQVAGALDYAHQQSVIHRDIKPENILLHEGEAMLADFGIALAVQEAGGNRLTETGLSLGTPQYMSPEQATGARDLDARSDVYSLGAVLYEMLAGEPPVNGPNARAIIAKLMTERPTRLRVVRDAVPEGVDAAVAKALGKVPADRFASASEFVRALALPRAADAAIPNSTLVTTTKPGSRHRGFVLGTAALLLLGGAATIFVLRGPALATASAAPTQLTYSGRVRWGSLAVSPDGEYVGYSESYECLPSTHCPYITVIQETSATGARSIVDSMSSRFVGWSRDSRRYLVVTSDAEHWHYVVRSVVGDGVVRTLSGNAAWSSSPDTLLEWDPTPTRDSSIWIRTVDATSGIVADSFTIRKAAYVGPIEASPDGRFLLVEYWPSGVSASSLMIVTRQGAIVDSIPRYDGGLGWGAHSDRVYMRRRLVDRIEVMRQDLDHNGRRTGTPRGVVNLDALDLTLGAGTIAFIRGGAPQRELWTLEWKSGPSRPPETRRIYHTTASGWADISRSGEHIYFGQSLQSGDTSVTHLQVIPFAGGKPISFAGTRLSSAWDFDISPDETQAVIAERRGGRTVVTLLSDFMAGTGTELAASLPDSGGVRMLPSHRVLWRAVNGREFVVFDDHGAVLLRFAWPDSLGFNPDWPKATTDGAILAFLARKVVANSSSYFVYRLKLLDGKLSLLAGPLTPAGSGFDWAGWWSADGWLPLRRWGGHEGEMLLRIGPQGQKVVVDGPLPIAGYSESFQYAQNRTRAIEWVTNRSSDVFLLRNFDPDDR